MSIEEIINGRQFVGEILSIYKKPDGNMYALVSLENGEWVEGRINPSDWNIIHHQTKMKPTYFFEEET